MKLQISVNKKTYKLLEQVAAELHVTVKDLTKSYFLAGLSEDKKNLISDVMQDFYEVN